MSISAQKLEDAANIASELVYSLENIPNEIRHILEEIKHKESRAQELQSQIDSDSARWIRHTLRGAAVSANSTLSPSPTKPIGHLPAKINRSYTEIEQLSIDKLALAERVVDLITRTCTRLDVDINRTRVLQGDIPSDLTRVRSVSVSPSVTTTGTGIAVASITDSMKQACNSSPSAMESRPSSNPPPKKRKLTVSATSPSTKAPPSRSISPVAATTKTAAQTRSRLSRQTYPPPRQIVETEEEEEPEIEEPEGDDEDDQKLYCFCQKPSAGDMIACDNISGCPYEWFHLECVGITEPPPDTIKWYCPLCINKVAGRKGRKKN